MQVWNQEPHYKYSLPYFLLTVNYKRNKVKSYNEDKLEASTGKSEFMMLQQNFVENFIVSLNMRSNHYTVQWNDWTLYWERQ